MHEISGNSTSRNIIMGDGENEKDTNSISSGIKCY